MRRIAALAGIMMIVMGCEKHDPILPGTRTAIFDTGDVTVLNETISDLPENIATREITPCPYTRDASNVIWDGERKIFSGFPTDNSVHSELAPVCDGKYVYAGLTTGELVKVNPKTRKIIWIADIYRPSNMTGGASMVDIVTPIVLDGAFVYVGGLGDAFCKINAAGGTKKWCANIGVATPFIVTDAVSFVVATDGYLYAIRNSDGAAYWRTEIEHQDMPIYQNGKIIVGRQKINAATGEII